uniref:NADPH:quinone oxidoreductase family protein n=1 Tax=Algihabitans albus TaxID=2164067 RepID=UPI000E5D63F1
MRALVCSAIDGASVAPGDLPRPQPGPGEVLVKVAAAGVNFADTLIVRGQYQEKPELPFAPGLELSGVVEATGDGVTEPASGRRIMALTGLGAFAEYAVAKQSDAFPLPEEMDFDTAAGFAVTYGTAHGALRWHADLQPGETLMVHGAAGGVGLAAVECGKAMGARVIASAGSPEKLKVASDHGADATIDYRQEDVKTRMRELTEGRGVDVVFDPVGGQVFDASLRATAWGGRLVVIGFAAGEVQQIPANILLVKNISVHGMYWGSNRKMAPQRLAEQFAELFDWYKAGRIKPYISHAYALDEGAQALADLRARKTAGKVVIRP